MQYNQLDMDREEPDSGGDLRCIATFGYGPTNDLWPFTLIDGARSFAAIANAGVVRLGRPDPGGPHYLTILFLLSQAIESALKSNLLMRGVTEAELMKIGHDLPRVLARAEAAGSPPPHLADYFLLRMIDGCYRHQKQLQYHRAREIKLPLLRPVRQLAHEYIRPHYGVGPDEPVNPPTAGWSIDPEADYGGPTLAQFREAAPRSGDPSDLTEVPGREDVTPPSTP
jgi:hypothetical protein